jgi:hypothetical protein
LEDVEKGKAGVDGADCSLLWFRAGERAYPKAIVTGPVCSDETKLQEPEEDPSR